MNNNIFRSRFLLLGLVLLSLGNKATAQDLEPRRWAAMPVPTNVLSVAYAHTSADIFFAPVLNIIDGQSDADGFALSYVRYFGWLGRLSRVDVLLPYNSGKWDGLLDGAFSTVNRKGMGDPRLRFSMSLYGTPVLSDKAFVQYRADNPITTVVGTAISVLSTPAAPGRSK
jgi:hypothetical protein